MTLSETEIKVIIAKEVQEIWQKLDMYPAYKKKLVQREEDLETGKRTV